MANYLVASGSRKISQLEIATNPVPAGSSSAMPLIIGDSFPATNATTVQITPDAFLSNLVFDASENYTGNNAFTGSNTFSGSVDVQESTFNVTNTISSVPYTTTIQGGSILFLDSSTLETLRIRNNDSNGFNFENYNPILDSSVPFLTVGAGVGRVDILRETHFSQNVVITGSLTALELFTTYETASIMYSSGSTKFGDTGDDEHVFSGSILLSGSLGIIDGGTLDGVDLSVFSSSIQTESSSFALRVTQNEGDISLLSSSYENFSGSQYNNDSASFSADITENSQSLSLLSGSYENFSGSQYNTDSSSIALRVTQNEGDISLLSGSFETTSSKLIDASGSFSTRVTNNELTGSDHEDRIIKGTNAVTSSAVSSSYIDLDVLANGDLPAHKAGRIFFGSEDGALEVYNEVTDFTLQVGQEFVIRAFNKSGGVIGNGTPVYASGSQGDRIGIYPATAASHSGTGFYDFDNHIIGIATHEIGISSEGYVTSQGIVRGIDTQNFTAGDLLFLQTGSPATPEEHYRNTPPPFPYDIVQVGYVARSAANGFIFAEPKEPVHFGIISGLSGSTNQEPGDLWVYQENGSFTTTHNLTGSYTLDGNIVGGQFTGSFSGSFEGDGTNITGVTAADVEFDNILNKPTLISQSQQVDADSVTNFDSNVLTYIDSLGVFSGSSQVDADNVTNFDSNVLTYINSLGAFSGSSQVDADNVTNFDSNVLTYNNSLGVVSGSSQVVFNDTSFNPFISTSAAISASNHFVPSDNEVYDLGTPTQRWRDLYLSGSTIDLGGLLIQKGADGNVQFIDSASQATKSVSIDSITGSLDITGNLTASNAAFNGNVEVTGSTNVSGSINVTSHGANGIILNEDPDNSALSSRLMFMRDYETGWAMHMAGDNFEIKSGSIPNSSSGTAKLKIYANSDNVEVVGGNLVIGTSGKGIDFSATSDGSGTTTSELLDDYEEGTWTPLPAWGGSQGTSTYTTTGHYTKVGNVVHAYANVQVTTIGDATGNFTITGLPFTSNAGYAGSPVSLLLGSVTASSPIQAYIEAGVTYISFEQTNNGTQTPLTHTNVTTGDSIYVRGTYTV